MPTSPSRLRVHGRLSSAAIALGTACLAGAGLVATAPAPATTSAAHSTSATTTRAEQAAARRLADRIFQPEAAPRLGAADAVALAGAPATADPVRFDRTALTKALRTKVARNARRWRQVGAHGRLLNSPKYATDEGRVPTSGIVLAIAVDPRSRGGKVAYVGTGGGLFRTRNAGKSWSRARAIPGVPVAAVAVDAHNHRDVYAVTGQGFQGGGEYGGLGAYWSHNAGRTWHAAKTSVRGAGQQVAVGPDGAVFAATTGGLFRSTDHGRTYKNVLLPTNAKG
ncbi:MAG: hypothetical protein JO222_01590, partial [Frankiales bacterium]|nr:hypothetical protein [Frankiales bacterium]